MSLLLFIAAALAGTPEQLGDDAVQANPGLDAMDAHARALAELANVADLWPDPMIALEYSNMAVSAPLPGNHPMSGVQLKASQTLPTPGVTDLRADVASGRVGIQEAATAEAELQLRKQVTQTWWRLALSRELAAVTEDHLKRTDELLAAVRSRYEVGSAGQSSLLHMQLLSDRLADELGDYVRSDRELSAALARALGSDEVSWPTDVEVTALPVSGDVATWVAAALDNSPELRRLELTAQNAQNAAELARVDARPDVSVWAGYRVRTQEMDGTDLVSVGVGVPVPLNSRRAGAGAQAAQLETANVARAQHAATVDAIEASLEAAHARWERAARKSQTYTTVLIPAAEATLDATLSDFRVDKTDFASLYEAEIALLSLERMRVIAAAETRIQDAEIRALTGESP